MSGLDHFAVNVTEMDRSVEWYQRVFGFSVLKRWNTTTMVGRGNMKVGLFLRPKATAIGDIDQTVAITHVAFLIDGDKFDEALKKAQALGLKVEGPEDTGIAYSFFLSDPDGQDRSDHVPSAATAGAAAKARAVAPCASDQVQLLSALRPAVSYFFCP